MQHPDEGKIHAWLDGQLPVTEATALESHVAECAECSAAVAEARGFIAASSKIVNALDVVPAGVIPDTRVANRAWYASPQLRAAAALMIVAGASMLVLRDRDSVPLEQSASRVIAVPQSDLQEKKPQDVPQAAASIEAAREVPADGVGAASPAARQAASQVALDKKDAAPPANQNAMVVTGVATLDETSKEEIALVRVDTIATIATKVFRVAHGVEVTLTESLPAAFSTTTAVQRERRLQSPRNDPAVRTEATAQGGSASQSKAVPTSVPAPTVVPHRDKAKAASITSIQWSNPATGRIYTLSGPLTKEQLEAVRKDIERKKL